MNAACFPPAIHCSIHSTLIKTSHDVSQVCGRAQVLLKYVLLNIGQHHICHWRFCSFLLLLASYQLKMIFVPLYALLMTAIKLTFKLAELSPPGKSVHNLVVVIHVCQFYLANFSSFFFGFLAEAPLTILERADLNLGRK